MNQLLLNLFRKTAEGEHRPRGEPSPRRQTHRGRLEQSFKDAPAAKAAGGGRRLSASLNLPPPPRVRRRPSIPSSIHGSLRSNDSSMHSTSSDTSELTFMTYRDEKVRMINQEFFRRMKKQTRQLTQEETRSLLLDIEKEQERKFKRRQEAEESMLGNDAADPNEVFEKLLSEAGDDEGRRRRTKSSAGDRDADAGAGTKRAAAEPGGRSRGDGGRERQEGGQQTNESLEIDFAPKAGGPDDLADGADVVDDDITRLRLLVTNQKSAMDDICSKLMRLELDQAARRGSGATGVDEAENKKLAAMLNECREQEIRLENVSLDRSPRSDDDDEAADEGHYIHKIVELKLLVANQQATIDTLSSRLHNLRLADRHRSEYDDT